MSRRAKSLSVLTRFRVSLRVTTLALAIVATSAHAENPYVAEVTGTSSNVNVRSGPSTNFYPVLTVSAGDRLTVIGEESGWYAIVPPKGCYSLISKHYVDVGANGEGVVNGNAVRVRAGSSIDDHRYAVQRKLDKGAVVNVIGEEGDSFLKITPPTGARLWISGDYLVRVPDDRLGNSQPAVATRTQESPPQDVVTREVPVRIVERKPAQPEFVPQPETSQIDTDMLAMETMQAVDNADDNSDMVIPEDVISEVVTPEVVTPEVVTDDVVAMNDPVETYEPIIVEKPVETSQPTPTIEEYEIASPSYAEVSKPIVEDNTMAEPDPIEITMIPVPSAPINSDEAIAAGEIERQPSFLQTQPETVEPMALSGNTNTSYSGTSYSGTSYSGTTNSGTAYSDVGTTQDSVTIENIEPQGEMLATATPVRTEIVPQTTVSMQEIHDLAHDGRGKHETTLFEHDSFETNSRESVSVASNVDYTAGDQRENLTALDERFDAEMIKPVEDRRLMEIADGYRQLTERGDDRLVRLYAERRLSQIELAIATADAIRDIRSLTNNVARERRESLEQRSQLRPPPQIVTRGFDAKGELRASMIFASPVGPQRYRLVDPAMVVPRTLCYIEVPRELNVNIDEYLGRLVGIRASKKYLETGNVDPIKVLVAEEFVVLGRSSENVSNQDITTQANNGAMEMMAVVDVDTLD